MIKDSIDEGLKIAKEAGIVMTVDAALAGYYAQKTFLCQGKASCNSFISLAEACKGAFTIEYDPKKDHGVFSSGADALVAAAQLAVLASLVLLA